MCWHLIRSEALLMLCVWQVRLFTNPFLTAIQITQMVMGLIVLSVGSWRDIFGAGCDYLPKQTAILGVLMYSSYFALFVKLFVEHHILK